MKGGKDAVRPRHIESGVTHVQGVKNFITTSHSSITGKPAKVEKQTDSDTQ